MKYIFAILLILSSILVLGQSIPPTLIQGKLMDSAQNEPVDDGVYDLLVELYDGEVRWSEVQKAVPVINGDFRIELGKTVPLDKTLLAEAQFIKTSVVHNPTLYAQINPITGPPASTASQSPHSPSNEGPDTERDTAKSSHDKLTVTPSGYLEFFYSHNFNRPENNITALRGFDYINGSLMVGNFVMALDANYNNFSARLAINVGANPAQFYEQEPTTIPSWQLPSLSQHTWQFIQEALIGWEVESIPGLTLQAGVMATPIGIEGLPNHQTWKESMASPHMLPKDYRENWNWSRSNSFINVPDYHSGVRALYSRNERNHFGFFLLNGQNMITDNNSSKTIALSYLYMPNPKFHFSTVYMGGAERPTGAPEGERWRHLFDFTARWEVTENLAFMTQFVPGFEETNFGRNLFNINVFYASWKFDNDVRLALRYEHLIEKVAPGSSPVFLRSLKEDNSAGLYGFTTTLSVPIVPNHLTLRTEYRHDRSALDWFYKGQLAETGDPHEPYAPNAKFQNTLTFGLVGWF